MVRLHCTQQLEYINAYILGEHRTKIVYFHADKLHVVGYSLPVHQEITLELLQLQHLPFLKCGNPFQFLADTTDNIGELE